MRVDLQNAYVLHTRAFRDTSLLVDFFTETHGKVCAVARGARTQRSKFRGLLQAFVPVAISWSGKSELVTLTNIEPIAIPFNFTGTALISAMYINELLEKLLARHDPHQHLFASYQSTLKQLQQQPKTIAENLRTFEKTLLGELGYGFDWQHTANTGEPIIENAWYVFIPEQGFFPAQAVKGNYLAFQGAHLLAIAKNQWQDPLTIRCAKQLLRAAINPLLHGKTIRSRELFSESRHP